MKLSKGIVLDNIIFCPEKHLVAIGENSVHVLDSIEIKEIENYPLESQVSVMMFSEDGNKIYIICINGQLYVIDRVSKTVHVGDRIQRQKMFYGPELYDESLVMPLFGSEGFALVVQGQLYTDFINDWYYVDYHGHVTSYFSISHQNDTGFQNLKSYCTVNHIFNDPYVDGCYYLSRFPTHSLVSFNPVTRELKTLLSFPKAMDIYYVSGKDGYMLINGRGAGAYIASLPKYPGCRFEDLEKQKLYDDIPAETPYAKNARTTRLFSNHSTHYFDISKKAFEDVPSRYLAHPTPYGKDLSNCYFVDMDNIRVVSYYIFVDFYDIRTDKVFCSVQTRNLF